MSDDKKNLSDYASELAIMAKEQAEHARDLAEQAIDVAMKVGEAANASSSTDHSFLMNGITIFILACFVGYYVVWRVTPALHSPLMGITNAISSVIIVGALLAAGLAENGFSVFLGFMAVILASINIFGGFIVTKRMLQMFKKKDE